MMWLASVLALGVMVFLRHRQRECVFFAALLEQGRREVELAGRPPVRKKPLHYRPEQSIRAVQQRLSRHWGKRAFSSQVKTRIEEALYGMDLKE